MKYQLLNTGLLSVAALTANSRAQESQCQPWTVDKPDRIFVMTDISNEPDDSMSLIRLLTHSDMYTVEGISASTSFWLPNATRPDEIQKLIDAYSIVQPNLQSHSNKTFPTATYLRSKVFSGPPVYGMEAITALESSPTANLSTGATALITAVDSSPSPLYLQLWGGSNTLATALWHVNRTRTPSDLSTFTSKLRIYSISDQDDTGPWIRHHFPAMRYIASRDGFNMYGAATWNGISGNPGAVDAGGPNDTIVQNAWLDENIRVGPLGALYPQIAYIMEGDSPSLLYHFKNGLGNPEEPSWGSWGGRYTSNPLWSRAQYADSTDIVVGLDGRTYNSNKASVWRWREAFQNEFAARMQWTLAPSSSDATAKKDVTHPPGVVINASCGSQHITYAVHVNETITLDASASWSPDENADLQFEWFQYKEPSHYQVVAAAVPTINFTYPSQSENPQRRKNSTVEITIPQLPTRTYCLDPSTVTGSGQYKEASKCKTLHVVLRVKDTSRRYYVERYRRVLLQIQPYGVDDGS